MATRNAAPTDAPAPEPAPTPDPAPAPVPVLSIRPVRNLYAVIETTPAGDEIELTRASTWRKAAAWARLHRGVDLGPDPTPEG